MNAILPPMKEVFAYIRDGEIVVALHGGKYEDDRRVVLTPSLALQLAEALIRAVRNPNADKEA
jgi:hypothetical protein